MSSLVHVFRRTMSSTGATTTKVPASAERKLKQTELDFMKVIERQNLLRVSKLKALRKRNILTGLGVGATVLSIYLYSMLAVKQEKFLDDFNEPQKVAVE